MTFPKIVIGKKYRFITKFWTGKELIREGVVRSIKEHSEYTRSYFVVDDENRGGYLWFERTYAPCRCSANFTWAEMVL